MLYYCINITEVQLSLGQFADAGICEIYQEKRAVQVSVTCQLWFCQCNTTVRLSRRRSYLLPHDPIVIRLHPASHADQTDSTVYSRFRHLSVPTVTCQKRSTAPICAVAIVCGVLSVPISVHCVSIGRSV